MVAKQNGPVTKQGDPGADESSGADANSGGGASSGAGEISGAGAKSGAGAVPGAGADPDVSARIPATIRGAGALASLEGLIGLGIAVALVVHGSSGAHDGIRGPGASAQPYGTAAWFAILAAAVLAAGVSLIRGRRWGRAIVVIAQVLLLPVAWNMVSSHRLELAIPIGLAALVTLGLTFAPPSAQWMARGYGIDPDPEE